MNWAFSEMLPIHCASIGIGVVATIIAAYLYRMAKAHVSARNEWQRKPEDIAWSLLAELYGIKAKSSDHTRMIVALTLWTEKAERMKPFVLSQVGTKFADEMALRVSINDSRSNDSL